MIMADGGGKNKRTIIIVAAISAAVLSIAGFMHRKGESARMLPPEPIPEIVLRNPAGQDVSLEKFRGTPAVIAITASWCGPCMRQMADIAALEKEFDPRVAVVRVYRREAPDFLLNTGSDAATSTFLLDPADMLYSAIHGFAMPEILFIDANGVIRYHARGRIEMEELRRRVQNLLENI